MVGQFGEVSIWKTQFGRRSSFPNILAHFTDFYEIIKIDSGNHRGKTESQEKAWNNQVARMFKDINLGTVQE